MGLRVYSESLANSRLINTENELNIRKMYANEP
jgi:hypothetical protein